MKERVNPDMSEILVLYVEHRKADLATLEALVAADGPYAKAVTIGHNVGGTSEAYGLNGLNSLAKRIEAAAKRSDREALRTIIIELRAYLDSLELVYDESLREE